MTIPHDEKNEENVARHLDFLEKKTALLRLLSSTEDEQLISNLFTQFQSETHETEQPQSSSTYKEQSLEFNLSDYKRIKIELLNHYGSRVAWIEFTRQAAEMPQLQVEIIGPDGQLRTAFTEWQMIV